MHVLVTGGTGFIGTALVGSLLANGDQVTVLSRQSAPAGPARYITSLDILPATERVDCVVNLAGYSLAARRWTTGVKREIIDSRLDTTNAVVELIGRLQTPPQALLSASAIGYYGHHGDEYLAEDAACNPGFSSALCKQWEDCAKQAEAFGVRVALLRLGVVLDAQGGALESMRRSFQSGVASWAGSGRQWLSWIHRTDVVRAIVFLAARDDLYGPFNLTSPEPVTAREFAGALAVYYPTLLKMGVPGTVMRLVLGEMAEELLLNGQRVVPARLREVGFDFTYADVTSALAAIHASKN